MLNLIIMKKTLIPAFGFLLLSLILVAVPVGCVKEKDTQSPAGVQGLWVGSYTVNTGASYYFSFSIYPDGKLSYKSKGLYNGSAEYITFADGTWTLNGTNFTFNVTTINIAGGGTQHIQFGAATYNSSAGTLTAGTITDPLGGNATWTMSRVN